MGFFLQKKVRLNNLLVLQKKEIDLIVKTFLHDGEKSCYRYLVFYDIYFEKIFFYTEKYDLKIRFETITYL